MHYGHPDVFDRIFHITRGGISKASRVINISEDIYAGNGLLPSTPPACTLCSPFYIYLVGSLLIYDDVP